MDHPDTIPITVVRTTSRSHTFKVAIPTGTPPEKCNQVAWEAALEMAANHDFSQNTEGEPEYSLQ